MADDDPGRKVERARRHPSEQHRRQFSKNLALLLALVGFSVLFYVIALVRMGGS